MRVGRAASLWITLEVFVIMGAAGGDSRTAAEAGIGRPVALLAWGLRSVRYAQPGREAVDARS
jgi:hypothetical protein